MPSDDVPTGALTFLFTDLVDSTYLWEQREAFAYLAFLEFRDRARAVLGTDRFHELRAEGRRLTPDDAMRLIAAG